MIQKPLDAITIDHVESLAKNGVREQKTIEYKLKLHGSTDAEKKEFLADVSSLANAGGGDLIYGIDAKDGIPTAILGLSDFKEDAERLRLESSIRDGVAPRVPGIQLKVVEGLPKGEVLIIRVPRSWAGPHMVTFKGTSRFFSRNSAGKFPMDVTEIRTAFEASGDLPERIREWRDKRLSRIVANEGPAVLASSTCLVVHLIPFDFLTNRWRFQVEDLQAKGGQFKPLCSPVGEHRVNVDGLLAFTDALTGAGYYAQLFRSGCVEGVNADVVDEKAGTRFLRTDSYERDTVRSVESYLKVIQELGVQPPIVFFLTLLGARGAYPTVGLRHPDQDRHLIDRDFMMIPDLLIEDYGCSLERVLRPAFDSVWNACGMPRSLNYDENGNLRPR